MQENRIILIKAKIKEEIQTGDYKTLSLVLNVPRSTAVSRYERNNKEAVLIMSEIVKNRKQLINKLIKKVKK